MYLGEPNNKQMEVYIKNFKKNMVLGFISKSEKEIKEGTSSKTKGGLFMSHCKQFAFKTHYDEPMCVKIHDILKRMNKNRNTIKSKKRKAKKRDLIEMAMVQKIKDLNINS